VGEGERSSPQGGGLGGTQSPHKIEYIQNKYINITYHSS